MFKLPINDVYINRFVFLLQSKPLKYHFEIRIKPNGIKVFFNGCPIREISVKIGTANNNFQS